MGDGLSARFTPAWICGGPTSSASCASSARWCFCSTGFRRSSAFPVPRTSACSGLLILAAFLETVGSLIDSRRCLYQDRGVHPLRRGGLRLFHGACAALFLPARQWRRAGCPVLLRIDLSRLRRRRPVERRLRDAEAGLASSPARPLAEGGWTVFDTRRKPRVFLAPESARRYARATQARKHERQRRGARERRRHFGPHRPAAGDAHDLDLSSCCSASACSSSSTTCSFPPMSRRAWSNPAC